MFTLCCRFDISIGKTTREHCDVTDFHIYIAIRNFPILCVALRTIFCLIRTTIFSCSFHKSREKLPENYEKKPNEMSFRVVFPKIIQHLTFLPIAYFNITSTRQKIFHRYIRKTILTNIRFISLELFEFQIYHLKKITIFEFVELLLKHIKLYVLITIRKFVFKFSIRYFTLKKTTSKNIPNRGTFFCRKSNHRITNLIVHSTGFPQIKCTRNDQILISIF